MLLLGRKLWLPLLILGLAALFTAVQTRAYSAGHLSAVQQPGYWALRPFQEAAWFFRSTWSSVEADLTQQNSLYEKNIALKKQVALLQVRNDHLAHVAQENAILRRLLGMKQHDPAGARWTAADVVERHPSHWFETLTLDRGSSSGIKQHSVVITTDGLVGQVLLVRPESCDVTLLTDPASNAGAIIPRTHDIGYVEGTGHKELIMSFFDRDHGVKVGDQVVSSPFSAIYPSGILIGSVTAITQQAGTAVRTALVRPSVQFNNLEVALVIP